MEKDVTKILTAIEQGDQQAANDLLPLVYDQLRSLAAQKINRESAPLPALALAYFESGQTEKALEYLGKSAKQENRWLNAAENNDGRVPVPWFDWLEFQVLYRQAARQIKGLDHVDDPRIEELRQQAEQKIN